ELLPEVSKTSSEKMEQHDIIATPQEVGSCLSANIPDTSLVRRRRGRPMKEIPNGHCSSAFSSDSLLENTTSSVIMSNQTQVNINTPVLVTDLLPRCRGRPPLTDISNEYLDHEDPTNICGACNDSLWDFEARLKRPFHNLWSYSMIRPN
ncbi:hypothetical protein Tco_0965003, partial [Tanacetum coccineum]